MKKLSPQESEIISQYYGTVVNEIATFKRLEKGGEVFYCASYSRVKRRNSYTVLYSSSDPACVSYWHILYFIQKEDKAAVVVRKMQTLPILE